MSSISVLVTMMLCIASTSAIQTHMVYWNSTNPIFRIDNTDHIVDVNQGNLPWEYDQLNIICPQNSREQHVIYSVSREEFDSCRVTSPRPKIIAICNKPETFMYFTITFRSFSPTPGGMEFKPGQNYYLISTSTTRDIHRRVGGFCSSHNMKMIFKVAEKEEQPSVNTNQRMIYNSPMYTALQTSSRRPASTTTTTTQIPIYYYKSRTPAVHTSDYIYYYSPRDLVQLKLAAKKHSKYGMHDNSENETFRAARLTSASVSVSAASCLLVMAISGLVKILV
eukprot:GFUD01044686.1.p1 GENE.GFUD01044686.1~~GFUD01044686.1.p1  ORF type:complete len:280 (+),score=36.17 GFUD01044686.1:104-943(+)